MLKYAFILQTERLHWDFAFFHLAFSSLCFYTSCFSSANILMAPSNGSQKSFTETPLLKLTPSSNT